MKWAAPLALSCLLLAAVAGSTLLGACQQQDGAKAQVILAQAEATRIANGRQARLNDLEIQRKATAQAANMRVDMAVGAATERMIQVGSYMVLAGVAILAVVLLYGLARRVQVQSAIYAIHVEPATQQAPPFLITSDGYLIDTRTGERAKVRDAAGVNKLRLQAGTQLTGIALATRAVERVGKAATSAQPADMLPGIVQSVPLIGTGEEDR